MLYGCLFASMLFSSEAWGNLSKVDDSLLKNEAKALKSCLGIKSGTSTELVYQEINKPDIIAIIKDRQFKFAEKIKKLGKDEALVKEIWDICIVDGQPTSLRQYYEQIGSNNAETNINERRSKIETSEQSMCIRYKTIIGLEYCPTLYQSCLDDTKRKMITRWRMSSHKLRIETGRFSRPFIERKDRLCQVCSVIEDEEHALYDCSAHRVIREKYRDSLHLERRNIKELFNPADVDLAKKLAAFLSEIEENMKDLEMT